jgi:hypothetical protein
VSKVKTYNLLIRAAVGSYAVSDQAFVVEITNHCPTTTITTISIPDKVYTTTDPVLSFTFNEWTQPFAYCNPFAYTMSVTALGSGVGSSFISFDSSSRTFSI